MKELIDWYRENRILYPWRRTSEPYRVWLSEILLQQTRIPVALPFYERIFERFPTLTALARADYSDFLSMWSGIGYYRRAENMLACARKIESSFGGKFPSELAELLRLPGIGRYTAGAIRNLCFGLLTPAIDGNTRRVLARITANEGNPDSKGFQASIETAFLDFGKEAPSSEYFQSLMELGERVCLPEPRCSSCPVTSHCRAHRSNKQRSIPMVAAKQTTLSVHWYFLVIRKKEKAYFIRNPKRSFLKNAWLFPDVMSSKALKPADLKHEFHKQWKVVLEHPQEVGTFRHAVTFRRIVGHVVVAGIKSNVPRNGKWLTEKELKALPTSSAINKAFRISGRYLVDQNLSRRDKRQ